MSRLVNPFDEHIDAAIRVEGRRFLAVPGKHFLPTPSFGLWVKVALCYADPAAAATWRPRARHTGTVRAGARWWLETLRRPRTNTPLQVLNTLNDPVFFEAAQGLATRMQKQGGPSPAQQVAYGFRLVTARAPAVSEARHLQNLYQQQRSRLEKNTAAAAQLLQNPTADPDAPAAPAAATTPQKLDQAALTLVANVLLNLDEALTKE